jgi:hypothetical protein
MLLRLQKILYLLSVSVTVEFLLSTTQPKDPSSILVTSNLDPQTRWPRRCKTGPPHKCSKMNEVRDPAP